MITFSRLVLVGFFVGLFLKERYEAALICLGLAGVTDFFDGFVARHFHQRSRLGSLLDPAADKIMMLAGYLLMCNVGRIPWALAYLIIGRDVLISIGVGVLNLMRIKLLYRPTRFSKFATASQITVLVISFTQFMIAQKNPQGAPLGWAPFWLDSFLAHAYSLFLILAYVLTTITVFQYSYIGYKFYRYGERKN